MSLGYDILLVITRLYIDMNLTDDWHANPTPLRCDNTLMLRSRGLRNLTTTSTTLSYGTNASMTR
jgi:hypothetical protein